MLVFLQFPVFPVLFRALLYLTIFKGHLKASISANLPKLTFATKFLGSGPHFCSKIILSLAETDLEKKIRLENLRITQLMKLRLKQHIKPQKNVKNHYYFITNPLLILSQSPS